MNFDRKAVPEQFGKNISENFDIAYHAKVLSY